MRLLITSKARKHLWKTKQIERSRGFILIMVLSSALNLSMISATVLCLAMPFSLQKSLKGSEQNSRPLSVRSLLIFLPVWFSSSYQKPHLLFSECRSRTSLSSHPQCSRNTLLQNERESWLDPKDQHEHNQEYLLFSVVQH